MAAISTTEPVKQELVTQWRPAGSVTQFSVLLGWSLRSLLHDRRLVVIHVMEPLVLLVVFSQVFGRIADPSYFPRGVGYIDYLMPAILVTNGVSSAVSSGSELVQQMNNGVLTRFRALPIGVHWILVARAVTDVLKTGVQSVLLFCFAAAFFGFRPRGGIVGSAAAVLLALVVIASLTWVFIALGAWLKSTQAMQAIGSLALFPLMFASSAFVPMEVLPTWLRAFAYVNPVSYAVKATRSLALDWPLGPEVIAALTTSLVMMTVAMTIAIRIFRRP
ncbi:ABC transporter permease [Streptomyces griseoviridis]|uniref:ABC transporter permease n=1 Tax=Streptomyces TaxID=1883 RepID=UPI002476C5F9|nr:ABC transporter permease [Streptomyces sp. MAA16]MDH6703307.1 ABC-2 type transport system permease protein [Streptomyces sp. MAA16]